MGICRARLTNCPGALTKCQNAMRNRWAFRSFFNLLVSSVSLMLVGKKLQAVTVDLYPFVSLCIQQQTGDSFVADIQDTRRRRQEWIQVDTLYPWYVFSFAGLFVKILLKNWKLIFMKLRSYVTHDPWDDSTRFWDWCGSGFLSRINFPLSNFERQGDSPLSQRPLGANCHVMYKLLYHSIRVGTAPPVSVRIRVRVSVSFSFTV